MASGEQSAGETSEPKITPEGFDTLAVEACEEWEGDTPLAIAIDTETTGTAYFDTAFAASIAWTKDGKHFAGHYFELDRTLPAKLTRHILVETPVWVFHNPKFDLQKLLLHGIIEREWCDRVTIHDTEALAHLLDENRSKRLKDLAVEVLGWSDVIEVPLKSDPTRSRSISREKYELDEAKRKVAKELGCTPKQVGYHLLPREVVMPYAIQDARMTAMLFEHLHPQLLNKDKELLDLYQREMELSLVLLDVETAGLGLDVGYVEETTRATARSLFQQELIIRKLTGREEFIDHHEWIKSAFTERGVQITDTQKATLADVDDPLAKAILEYRRLRKLHSTYLAPMLAEQRDGILHPGFRQHGTRTGRMSSGGVVE